MDGIARDGARSIAAGSKSFAAASRLFDRATRESVVMLYAWCRHCDDIVDGQDLGRGTVSPSGTHALARVTELEIETRRVLAGQASRHSAFEGLGRVVRRHAIPPELPLAHLAGFRMDAEGRRYETIEDTLDYCYHVAGVVGVMMAHVMGVRDRATTDRASDLGIAFQLTNIARDIVPDAEAGRVYVPDVWLAQEGIPPAALAAPEHRAALARIAARLVQDAEPYYDSAGIGIARLPRRAAWAVATARGLYREIGLEVVRRGPEAWDERVSTSPARKIAHVAYGGVTVLSLSGEEPAIPREGLWTRPA